MTDKKIKTEGLSDFNQKLVQAIGKDQISNNMLIKSQPRISLNKLAEYMDSNSIRRRQIVMDAKNPQKFKTTRYSEARKAIRYYILEDYDEDVLLSAISMLEKKPVETEFQRDDIANSILALQSVMEMDMPDLGANTMEEWEPNENSLINLKGVDVSIYPDLIIKTDKTGKVGLLKIHISKTNILSDESLKYAATMLKYYELSRGTDEKQIEISNCVSIDVFAKKFETSPNAYKLRLGRIEAACEEIGLWWDKL